MAQDARVLAYILTVTAVVSSAVLALAARIRRWPATDYLGFVRPDGRKTAVAVGVLLAVFAAIEGATYLLGYENETQFDRELFLRAQTSGTMPLLLYTLVV